MSDGSPLDPEDWRIAHWREAQQAMADERNALHAENQRLREAIADALVDLTPGIVPHDLLTRALSGESL